MIKTQTAAWLVTAGVLVTTAGAITATQVIDAGSAASSSKPTDPGMGGGNVTPAVQPTAKATKDPKEPSGKSLTVGSINVTGLVPGASLGRQLTVQNPNNQDVELQTVKTVITGPTPSGACTSPADVEVIVAGYNASTGAGPVVTIAKNSTLNLPVTVRMNNRPVNQDGCKSRTFRFTFTATATSK